MSTNRDIVDVAGPRRDGFKFALPWLIGLVGLTLVPAAISLLLSFTRWDGLSLRSGIEWAGTDHYREMFTGDRLFYKALGNTLYYALIAVPAGSLASLAAALLLNSRARGIAVFRTIYMLPYMLSGVATVMIWSWLLNPRFGLINAGLMWFYRVLDPLVRLFHESGTSAWVTPDWFYSPAACKPALIILHVWLGGGTMLVFLAALQRVPTNLLDAAAIDGAGRWQRFRHVTLPHISPAILFNLIVGLVFAMQSFDQSYLLFNRAQRDGLLFYMLHLYRIAFEPPYRVGYASALAWILFITTAVMASVILLIARRRIYYAVNR